jgi:hypothetical protein
MIGAAVDIPYKVYKYLGYLGPKLYFLRLSKMNKTEDDFVNEMGQDEYPVKFAKVREALNDYLNIFASCPDMSDDVDEAMNRISHLRKMAWSKKDDDKKTSRLIVRLAMLLSHLSGCYDFWRYRGTWRHRLRLRNSYKRRAW